MNNISYCIRNRLNKTVFQDPNILFSKSHIKKTNEITRFIKLILVSHLIINISRNIKIQG